MAEEIAALDLDVVLGEEIGVARLITLNQPHQLNVISSRVVSLLAEHLENWEKEENADVVIFKMMPALKLSIECISFAITSTPIRKYRSSPRQKQALDFIQIVVSRIFILAFLDGWENTWL